MNNLLTKYIVFAKIRYIELKIFMMLQFIKPKMEKRFRLMMNPSRKGFAS